jgi:hypothetical protein
MVANLLKSRLVVHLWSKIGYFASAYLTRAVVSVPSSAP